MSETISRLTDWGKMPMRMKDISDWVKIVIMLAFGFFAYQHLVDVVNQQGHDIATTQQQTQRIERYLSSKDPNYWQAARALTDPDPP